jgi:putative heme transporter
VEPPRTLQLSAAIAWRVLVVVAAIVVLALMLAALRIIFLPFVVALLFATLFDPAVRALRRRGVPGAAATLGVLLGTLVVLGGGITLAAPYVAAELMQLGELEDRVRAGVEAALVWAVEGPLGLTEAEVTGLIDRGQQQLREIAPQAAGGALGGAVVLIEIVLGALLTLVLMFFFLSDGARMWQWATRLFPAEQRAEVASAGQRVWAVLGGYLRAQMTVALVDAVLIGLLLVVLGVPLAIPLAVLVFFGGFVPVIGGFATGFLAVMVALAADGVQVALFVLLGIVVVQQLEGSVLQPYLVGRSVSLHPVAVLLAVTAGAVVWGIPGAFIATPLLASVYAAAAYLSRGRSRDIDGALPLPALPPGTPGEPKGVPGGEPQTPERSSDPA